MLYFLSKMYYHQIVGALKIHNDCSSNTRLLKKCSDEVGHPFDNSDVACNNGFWWPILKDPPGSRKWHIYHQVCPQFIPNSNEAIFALEIGVKYNSNHLGVLEKQAERGGAGKRGAKWWGNAIWCCEGLKYAKRKIKWQKLPRMENRKLWLYWLYDFFCGKISVLIVWDLQILAVASTLILETTGTFTLNWTTFKHVQQFPCTILSKTNSHYPQPPWKGNSDYKIHRVSFPWEPGT